MICPVKLITIILVSIAISKATAKHQVGNSSGIIPPSVLTRKALIHQQITPSSPVALNQPSALRSATLWQHESTLDGNKNTKMYYMRFNLTEWTSGEHSNKFSFIDVVGKTNCIFIKAFPARSKRHPIFYLYNQPGLPCTQKTMQCRWRSWISVMRTVDFRNVE